MQSNWHHGANARLPAIVQDSGKGEGVVGFVVDTWGRVGRSGMSMATPCPSGKTRGTIHVDRVSS